MRSLPHFPAFISTFSANVAVQVLTAASGVLVARCLLPQGRGVYAAVELWPGVVVALGLLGVNYSLAICAANMKQSLAELSRLGVSLGIVLSAIIVGGLWFVGPSMLPVSLPHRASLTRLYITSVPLTIIHTYLQAIDLGGGRLNTYNVARLSFNVAYAIAVFAFWRLGVGEVQWFIAAFVFAKAVALVVRLHLTGWQRVLPAVESAKWSAAISEGLPFMVTNAVQLAKEYSDKLFLLYVLGVHDLGLYVVSVTAAGLHMTLSRSVSTLVLPRSGALSPECAAQDAARIFRVMLLVSGVASTMMIAVLPSLIKVIFGPSFQGAVGPAMILVLSQYFGGQASILNESLRGQSRPYVGMFACVSSLAIFGVLVLGLAAPMGVVGVAVASVGSQIVYCAVPFSYFRRILHVDLLPLRSDVKFLQQTTAGLWRRNWFTVGRG